jgi:hypothetical protein
MSARLSPRALLGRTMARENNPLSASFGWHPRYAACQRCQTTVRPHHTGGLCTDCWRSEHGVTPVQIDALAPPSLPVRRRGRP